MDNLHLLRRSEGGKAPTPGFLWTFRFERFEDHAGNKALRVYMSDQDPMKPNLQPLWSYQIYVPSDPSTFDANTVAKDIFDTFTDNTTGENVDYWRFEFFFMPPDTSREKCAEHYRKERDARKDVGPPIPDYTPTCTFSSVMLIIREPARWKPNGVELYMFDIEVDGYDGSVTEDVEENAWVRNPIEVDGIEMSSQDGNAPVSVFLDDTWDHYPNRREMFVEPVYEARQQGRMSWDV